MRAATASQAAHRCARRLPMTRADSFAMRSIQLLVACALCACETFKSISTDSGFDATPTNNDSGRDATGHTGFDSGHDADDPHVTPTQWIASKTTLDVWWPSVPIRDPGRGEIEAFALIEVADACGQNREATLKLCGLRLPTYTSDVLCDASQIQIPDSVWDNPRMPAFTTRSFDEADASTFASTVVTMLVGIELPNAGHDDNWPTLASAITCEAGRGAACFPDHDDDMLPGITAHVRDDGAIHVGANDDGRCYEDVPYRYRGAVASIQITADAPYPQQLADQIHLGFRTSLNVDAPSDGECSALDLDATSTRIGLRAIGCTIDPATLGPADPRIASMGYACTDDETLFVDNGLPEYRVLNAGERPGDTRRPLGWTYNGRNRDIDRHISTGSSTTTVILNVDDLDAGGDGEPSCAQVRQAFATAE